MLRRARPEDVAQGDAVIVRGESGDVCLQFRDDRLIVAQADIVALDAQKARAVLVVERAPRVVEIRAVARTAAVVRVLQALAHGAVICIVLLQAPLEKRLGRVIAAGKLIGAVGLFAEVARPGRDHAWAARLELGAERAEQGFLLIIRRRRPGKQEHQARQQHRDRQKAAQRDGIGPFSGFHRITPSDRSLSNASRFSGNTHTDR